MDQAEWRRSSRCDGGQCLEVAFHEGAVLMRDSKMGGGSPVLHFTHEQWQRLLDWVANASPTG